MTAPPTCSSFPIDDDHLPSGRHPDDGGRGPGTRPNRQIRRSSSVTSSCARRWRARQAPEHAGTVDDELALLVVHGVLHLLNYDHADEREAASMQRRERELLEQFRAARRLRAGEQWTKAA